MKKIAVISLLLALCSSSAFAQVKPSLVVHAFAVAPAANWPYDMNQLVIQTITELRIKDGAYFDVAAQAAEGGPRTFDLNGEVLEWHAGNRAARMFVGAGTGRETAKIRYWLTDKDGKKVFEHTDTIRQAFWTGYKRGACRRHPTHAFGTSSGIPGL